MTAIDRAFARLSEGLIHYRHAGDNDRLPPILMMHPSPASSRALQPLIQALGAERRVIAPDTLGNGDSAPPSIESPELGYYADSMLRLMDALDIQTFDVYGSHTGSHIGIEMAHQANDRIGHLVLHGIAVLDEDDQREFLTHYAPPQGVDPIGSQFNWAWHYVRDQMIFYPHFRKTPEHIRAGGHLDAQFLHELTVDVLKNLAHYHKTYHAVFKHDVIARLATIDTAAAILAHQDDPLNDAIAVVRARCANVSVVALETETPVEAAASIVKFTQGESS